MFPKKKQNCNVHAEYKKVTLHVIIGFSVLTNWFFPALLRKFFSRGVLLTFCWHNIESLVTDDGLEWKRWKILWKIQGCWWFSAIIVTVLVFSGENCEIAISLLWKLLRGLTGSFPLKTPMHFLMSTVKALHACFYFLLLLNWIKI